MLWQFEKPIVREFMHLALPTVLAGWVYIVYTITSGVFIGRFVGSQALAALNLILPVLYVPYAISLMIGIGAATLMARLRGEGKRSEVRRVCGQTLVLLLAGSMLLSGALLLWSTQIVAVLGASGTLAELGEAYLRQFAPFVLCASAVPALELVLRVESARAARVGLLAMTVGAVLNVGLDYLLIARLGWQMQGAALAAGLSLLAVSLIMLAWVYRPRSVLRPRFRWRHSHAGMICYNGLSEFMAALAPVVTIYAFNQAVLTQFGASGLAAYAVIEYMTLAATVTMVGLVQSMQPMLSYYRGAQVARAIRQTLVIGTLAVEGCAMLVAAGLTGFADQLTLLFLPQGGGAQVLISAAVPWYALAFLPAGVNLVIAGYLTAMERPGPSLVIALLRSWILLLGFLWGMSWLGGMAIWLTLLLTELATLLVSLPLQYRYRVDVAG